MQAGFSDRRHLAHCLGTAAAGHAGRINRSGLCRASELACSALVKSVLNACCPPVPSHACICSPDALYFNIMRTACGQLSGGLHAVAGSFSSSYPHVPGHPLATEVFLQESLRSAAAVVRREVRDSLRGMAAEAAVVVDLGSRTYCI